MWIWNQQVTRDEMLKQAQGFVDNGFGGVAVRPGRAMAPAYLSDEFFDLFSSLLTFAKSADIGVRIADDFSLPCGGMFNSLTGATSSFRAEMLVVEHKAIIEDKGVFEKHFDDSDFPERYLAFVGKVTNGRLQCASVKNLPLPQGKKQLTWPSPGAGPWMVMLLKKKFVTGPDGCYIPNMFNPRVAQTYIKDVLDRFKDTFSKFIPGTFEGFITEMPTTIPATNGVPWDDDLVIKYKSKYKKEMLKLLPALFTEVIESDARARTHCYVFIAQSMFERFATPLELWAKRFRLSQWLLTPEKSLQAEDIVPKDCFTIPSTPFSAVGIQNQDGIKESYSLCRALADINVTEHRRETITILGRNRQGHGSTIQSLKSDIESAILFGTDHLIIDGCFFNITHNNHVRTPYNPAWYFTAWNQMRPLNDYASRLYNLCHGLQVNRSVAVLLPTQSMMAEYLFSNLDEAKKASDALRKAVDSLSRSKISFDIITEERLLSCAIRTNGEFGSADRIRKGGYQALVIPYARLISRSLFVYIEKLAIRKGLTVFIDEAPVGNLDDGITTAFSERIEKLITAKKEYVQVAAAKELAAITRHIPKAFELLVNGRPCNDLEIFHAHGVDHDVFVVFSVSETKDYFATLSLPGMKYLYLFDCQNGETDEIKDIEITESGIEVDLALAPQQCYTLIASMNKLTLPLNKNTAESPSQTIITTPRSYRIVLKDQWTFTPESLNAMPLASWNTRIGLSRDSGSFSHFSESYFEIKEVPTECILLFCGIPVENQTSQMTPLATYEVSINGAVVEPFRRSATVGMGEPATRDAWEGYCGYNALKFNIRSLLVRGFNRIAIRTLGTNGEPYPMLYPPIIAGTFSISKGQKGWTIDVPTAQIGYDSWTLHGFPYLSGNGIYSQKFEVPSEKNRVVLNFSQVSGVVDVKINDVDLGVLAWQPLSIDITGKCEQRRNDLTIRVCNTMDNLLRMNARPSGLIGEVYLDVYEND
jgi:hypothetical protein